MLFMPKENSNSIFRLRDSFRNIKSEIPKGFQDCVSDDILKRVLDNSLEAQYYINRLNEYCKSNYELKLINLRDENQ